MADAVEREVKLAAWAGFVMPSFDDLPDGVDARQLPERNLDAVYYDTADLRLARRGASLRFRQGDRIPWTVKLPEGRDGPLLARREVSFAAPSGSIPPAAASLVRAYTRSAPLRPVIRLKTRRVPVELSAEGDPVVEVVDDEVSVFEGRRMVSRFREVEVEVADGAPAGLLPAVLSALRLAGATEGDPSSKVARALGPRARMAPEPLAVRVGSGSAAGEAVRAAISASVGRLIVHDPGVRLGDDPEDVHQARVATRRLRSDLRTFRPLVGAEWAGKLSADAAVVAALLGEVRDPEVMVERLVHQLTTLAEEDRGAAEPLLARLGAQRAEARSRLLEELDSPRYAALLERLVEAARVPVLEPLADRPGAEVLPALVRRPWRRLRQAVEAMPAQPPDVALHDVRILAKRCRYAAEAVAGVCGRQARVFAEAVAGLQGILGDHQDAVVAEDWLRGRAREAGPGEAMILGQLIGLQRAEAAARRTEWRAAWRRASQPRLRAFMR